MKNRLALLFALVLLIWFSITDRKLLSSSVTSPVTSPKPSTFPLITNYQPPVIKSSDSYTFIFVGDSMTESLGPNFDALRRHLSVLYPQKTFGLFNYGFGSTNLLSVDDRLNKDITYQGQNFPAILKRNFDVIFFESFGDNPLSQYPLDQGLTIQSQTLDHLVAEIAGTKPNALIIFLATIAPSRNNFGKGAVALNQKQRDQWVSERRAYIENHIHYAQDHHIPLINVYSKSQDSSGDGLVKYLDASNYIHPSVQGVELISAQIADYLSANHLIPN